MQCFIQRITWKASLHQSSHYGKYGMHDCQSAHHSYWYKSGCVTFTWCIITLRFTSSSSNIWSKQRIRQEAPLLALHLLKSHTEAITRIPQIVTYEVREKRMEYIGEQRWALVEPRYKHWSCCSWQKDTSPEEAALNSQEIKPVAMAIIELCLSEGISKGGVSQSVSRKFD